MGRNVNKLSIFLSPSLSPLPPSPSLRELSIGDCLAEMVFGGSERDCDSLLRVGDDFPSSPNRIGE